MLGQAGAADRGKRIVSGKEPALSHAPQVFYHAIMYYAEFSLFTARPCQISRLLVACPAMLEQVGKTKWDD